MQSSQHRGGSIMLLMLIGAGQVQHAKAAWCAACSANCGSVSCNAATTKNYRCDGMAAWPYSYWKDIGCCDWKCKGTGAAWENVGKEYCDEYNVRTKCQRVGCLAPYWHPWAGGDDGCCNAYCKDLGDLTTWTKRGEEKCNSLIGKKYRCDKGDLGAKIAGVASHCLGKWTETASCPMCNGVGAVAGLCNSGCPAAYGPCLKGPGGRCDCEPNHKWTHYGGTLWRCNPCNAMTAPTLSFKVRRDGDNKACFAAMSWGWKILKTGGASYYDFTWFNKCAQLAAADKDCGDRFWVKHCDNCDGSPCSSTNVCSFAVGALDPSCTCAKKWFNPGCSAYSKPGVWKGGGFGMLLRGRGDPNFAGDFRMEGLPGNRTAILHMGDKLFSGSEKKTLVVNIHYWTGSALGAMGHTGMSVHADTNGYAVLYPQGMSKATLNEGNKQDPWTKWFEGVMKEADAYSWNAGKRCCAGATNDNTDDMSYFVTLIPKAIEHAKTQGVTIDPKKVYLTGFSNGAFMTHRLMCDARTRNFFTAAAASAGFVSPDLQASCVIDPPIPMMPIQGRQDDLVKMSEFSTYKAWYLEKKGLTNAGKSMWFSNSKTKCEKMGTPPNVVVICESDHGHFWQGGVMNVAGTALCGADCTAGQYNTNDQIWKFFNEFAPTVGTTSTTGGGTTGGATGETSGATGGGTTDGATGGTSGISGGGTTGGATGGTTPNINTNSNTAKKYTGSFEAQMTKAHADKLVEDVPKAKEALGAAYAKTMSLDTAEVVVKKILVDGKEVTTGGRRLRGYGDTNIDFFCEGQFAPFAGYDEETCKERATALGLRLGTGACSHCHEFATGSKLGCYQFRSGSKTFPSGSKTFPGPGVAFYGRADGGGDVTAEDLNNCTTRCVSRKMTAPPYIMERIDGTYKCHTTTTTTTATTTATTTTATATTTATTAVVKVEIEITTTKTVAEPTAGLAATLKTNIQAEAKKIDSSISISAVPTSGWAQQTSDANSDGSSSSSAFKKGTANRSNTLTLSLCVFIVSFVLAAIKA